MSPVDEAYKRLVREAREWADRVRVKKLASELATGPEGSPKVSLRSETNGRQVAIHCIAHLGTAMGMPDGDVEPALRLYEREVRRMLDATVPALMWLRSLGVDPHSMADEATVRDVMES